VRQTDISNEYDTLGFIMKDDPTLRRCFISNILPRSTAAQYPHWRTQLIGAFILTIDDVAVFTKDDTEAALSRCLTDCASSTTAINVVITFANDRSMLRPVLDPDSQPSPIQLDQICHIAQIYETGEETKYQPTLDTAWFQYFKNLLTHANDDNINQDTPSIHKTSTSQFTR
jgi:hypothetical protein